MRKADAFKIRTGPMVATRIPRFRYSEVQEAAQLAGLPIASWIRSLVYRELARSNRRKNAA
jgi:hypothetical protein